MNPCFLLTAGLGTRLRPLTDKTPKPCLDFLGHSLMDYGFYLAQMAGYKDFVFNLHYLSDQVKSHAQDLNKFCDSVSFSDETEKILGSGGALWKAKKYLENTDHFLVANGDEILIPKDPSVLKNLSLTLEKENSLCCLLTCDHPELLKTLKPVWVNQNGQVKGFGMDAPEDGLKPVHYTGYKVFSKRIFDFLPPGESNIFYDVLVDAFKQGEVASTYHLDDCHWYETGNPTDLNTAKQQCQSQHSEYLKQLNHFFERSK